MLTLSGKFCHDTPPKFPIHDVAVSLLPADHEAVTPAYSPKMGSSTKKKKEKKKDFQV
jgi:hypothetical protein